MQNSEKTKVQTTMKKNNLNPAWKESFDFDWHGEEIIKIECWDHNKVRSTMKYEVTFSVHETRFSRPGRNQFVQNIDG